METMETVAASRSMERRAYATPISTGIFGRRVSWPAVIAGVISATFVQLLLGSLGGAIGATTVAAADGAARGAGIGVGIWMVVSTVISMFVGGWVAGRMSGAPSKSEGAIHGFLTASLGTLFTLFLLASAVGGVFGTISNLAGGALQGAGSNPNATDQMPASLEQVQERISEAVPSQAQAGQAADTAAKGTAAAGFGVFALLLLACGASVAGGAVSAPKRQRIHADNS